MHPRNFVGSTFGDIAQNVFEHLDRDLDSRVTDCRINGVQQFIATVENDLISCGSRKHHGPFQSVGGMQPAKKLLWPTVSAFNVYVVMIPEFCPRAIAPAPAST